MPPGFWISFRSSQPYAGASPRAIGSHAVVIGAGNSAMDCARAARRLVGENGSVTIAYRRTCQGNAR